MSLTDWFTYLLKEWLTLFLPSFNFHTFHQPPWFAECGGCLWFALIFRHPTPHHTPCCGYSGYSVFQISKEWRKVWWFVMILIAGRIQKWGGSPLIWFWGSPRVVCIRVWEASTRAVGMTCIQTYKYTQADVFANTSVLYVYASVRVYTRQHTCKDTRHRASTDVTPQLPSDLLLPNLAPT